MDQAQQLRNIIKMNHYQQHAARVITITSGKGGVGKSSVSVNLAIELCKLGKRVIIWDADFGLANVEVMLGIRPAYTLADLMYRGKTLREIIAIGPENVGFISGGSGIQELVNLSKDQIINMSQYLYELDELADIIMIDTSAGIADNVIEFLIASSEILLVATPEPTSITDAYALLKTLNQKLDHMTEKPDIKMIANRVNSIKEGKELFQKLDTVIQKFLDIKVGYLGAIPQDIHVEKAIMQQRPISIAYPKVKASEAISDLAKMINENEIIEQKMRGGVLKLFSNLIRFKYNK